MGKFRGWLYVVLGSLCVLILSASTPLSVGGGETCPTIGGPIPGPSQKKPKFVADELLVKFKPGVSEERIQALVTKHSTTIKDVISGINWYVLKIHGGRSPLDLVEAFKQEPEVEDAEPQGYMEIQ